MKNILTSIARYFGYEIRALPPAPRHVVFDETITLDEELLKAFATRAARFSASAQVTQAVRNLYLTGLLGGQPQARQIRVEVGCDDTSEVGVWERSGGDAATFVRQADRRQEWFYWADKETIEPKRCKWRVALVGESVARGFHYDPHFNPGSALEGMLRSQLGGGEIDVVDLARSNLTLRGLKAMVGQSLALRPDVVVIFAGNNWATDITDSDLPHIENLVRMEGVPAIKSFIDACLAEEVRLLVSHVNSLLASRAVKVIWVVPDFNLGDWADPPSNAPILVGQGNKQWHDLREQAACAVREGDLVAAEKSAQKMVGLDGGTSAVPLRILAECARSKGDLQRTRRYLEMCRDAEGWDPSFKFSPRVSSSSQNALREAAAAHNNAIVDVPEILSRHLNDTLPDRRIFLDYCHLTAEGVNLVTAAVASQAIMMLTGERVPYQNLQKRAPAPPPKVEGKACLLAAVHNAHFYQGHDVVHYWCARALQFWPESAEIMTRFIDNQTRRVPTWACKSMIELFQIDEMGSLRYLLRGPSKRLDLVLGEAITQCLGTIGRDIGKTVSDLRAKEHSVSTGPKELTGFYYSSAIPGPSEPAWTSRSCLNNRGSDCIYASAFWRTSKFLFFAEKGQPITLKFTYRVPTLPSSGGTVEIDVNRQRVAQLSGGRTWQTQEIAVLGVCVVDGMNEIVITWPDDDGCDEAAAHRVADALLATGPLPLLYRVFGEIHALSASSQFSC